MVTVQVPLEPTDDGQLEPAQRGLGRELVERDGRPGSAYRRTEADGADDCSSGGANCTGVPVGGGKLTGGPVGGGKFGPGG